MLISEYFKYKSVSYIFFFRILFFYILFFQIPLFYKYKFISFIINNNIINNNINSNNNRKIFDKNILNISDIFNRNSFGFEKNKKNKIITVYKKQFIIFKYIINLFSEILLLNFYSIFYNIYTLVFDSNFF